MPLRVSCAPCRATVSRVVPACCAFIEVHSRSRACPQPTAIRVRATRRRAPPIGRAPPPDPCRARAARSFPRTPPLYLTLSPAHYALRRRARTSRLPSPRIFASLQTKEELLCPFCVDISVPTRSDARLLPVVPEFFDSLCPCHILDNVGINMRTHSAYSLLFFAA